MKHNLGENVKLIKKCIATAVAVSYTHLDVYKRQLVTRALDTFKD